MSIKNSIRFVEYSSVFVLCAFLLMVLSLVGSDNASFHINFWLLGASAILFLIYFFQNKIIHFRLQHSKYRNLFYQVIDKIHLTENVPLNYNYQPALPEKEIAPRTKAVFADNFIKENGLNTQVGKKKIQEGILWSMVLIFILLVALLRYFFDLDANNTTLLFILGLMCIAFCYLFGNYNLTGPGDIRLEFKEDGLVMGEKKIAWDKIIDWQYNRRDATNNSSISIYYFNTFLDVECDTVELFQLNIRKIDLVLLLTHFKEKYGKNIY